MAIIRGSAGEVRAGPTTGTEVLQVTSWTFNRTRAVTTGGPYINNDAISNEIQPKNADGTIEYDMFDTVDPGQDLIDAAFEAGTPVQIILKEDGGKTFTIAEALITSAPQTQAAADKVTGTFTFVCKSGYVVADSV